MPPNVALATPPKSHKSRINNYAIRPKTLVGGMRRTASCRLYETPPMDGNTRLHQVAWWHSNRCLAEVVGAKLGNALRSAQFRSATLCSGTLRNSTLRYATIQCNTIQYNTIQYQYTYIKQRYSMYADGHVAARCDETRYNGTSATDNRHAATDNRQP